MQKFHFSFFTFLFSCFIFSGAAAQMRITEYQYNGSEFVELTNVGTSSIDMTGWSFDDDSRVAGTVSLSSFGLVKAGESVILCETAAAAFRTLWNLCDNIKVMGNNPANLGRADEINIYDASNTLIDRLTYGDNTIGGPRTDVASAWASSSAMGMNTITAWTLSAVADAEGSYTSASGGFIASPGKSSRATSSYHPCSPGVMRITEYQYNGSEFIELTNVGGLAVDMTGWSFDDDSRVAGTASLSAFGQVQGGESVILCETAAAAFRTLWNLCDNIKVMGNNPANLGRADEINIYDASNTLIDRLTYGDNTIGGPRTDVASAWVSSSAMGMNTITAWTSSTVADAEGSYTAASGGFIASPGKSNRAMITFNPCSAVPGGAPTIAINVLSTPNFIDGGAAISPTSPFAVSAVLNDALDPLKIAGIDFIIADDITPVANLMVMATSSNQSVVANTGLTLSGTGANRKLLISPAAIGYSNITLTVTDGESNSRTFVLSYAVSSGQALAYWPTGISDASAAIALDNDHMLIANDETNLLYVFKRNQSGLPVKTIDINAANILGLTDGSTGNWKEVDIEAAAPSRNIANRIYWIGSLGNGTDGDLKPNRDRIFATNISGTGESTSITPAGTYGNLRTALINWGNTHGYNLSASAQNGHAPKNIDGFNVEGMVFAPNGTTMYIGFRAPLVPTANRTKALIAPIQNFESWFNNGTPIGTPTIGAPIELTLGNRGIRDIIRLSNGTYVIVAGSYNDNSIPAIFRWSGNATDNPLQIASFNLTGLNAEAVLPAMQNGVEAFDKLQIICDNGDNIFYNDGVVAKDLPNDSHKKFINYIVPSLEGNVLPVNFITFTAQRSGAAAHLYWNYTSSSPVKTFDILRSTDGSNFQHFATVDANTSERSYQHTDYAAGISRMYYRIVAKDITGQSYLSSIKMIDDKNANTTLLSVFPNPASTQLFISTEASGNKNIRIINATGVLISNTYFNDYFKEISTTGWSKGIYFVSIFNNKGKLIGQQKVVVQ